MKPDLKKIEGVKKSQMPKFIKPELAVVSKDAPKEPNWLHEVKFDGYRMLTFASNGTHFFSRNQQNWTHLFPHLKQEIERLEFQSAILDGEIVVFNQKGKTDFQLLQEAFSDQKFRRIYYFLFDILYCDGFDFRKVPLLQRKEVLKYYLRNLNQHSHLQFSDHILGNGEAVFSQACKLGLEGIISKSADSTYVSRRDPRWKKIKCTLRQEFVIVGYTDSIKMPGNLRSLLLATRNGSENLKLVGKVGTGFTEKTRASVHDQLKSIEVRHHKNTHWVKPIFVCEVEYTETTREGILRHPSFKGMRIDKPASEVKDELSSSSHSPISNPDKILFSESGITKKDLFHYYQKVQEWILPYVENRLLTLVRCPEGRHKECFYQKHIKDTVPEGILTATVQEKEKIGRYLYIKSVEGLLSLVQLGVLELHTWGSKVADLEYPDQVVFDLDPDESVQWKDVIETAKLIRSRLKEAHKLESFVKLTGGKGLHVVVPILPEGNWDQVKQWAKLFVESIVYDFPDRYVSTMSKKKRVGKIFLDYLRNSRGATFIAPFSTRRNPHAPLAVPMSWHELKSELPSNAFNIKNIDFRLRKLKTNKQDPWRDFFSVKQSLAYPLHFESA